MKILNARQTAELDSYTIKNEPVSSTDLMERAALAFTKWFTNNYPDSSKMLIFCGPGNNGGDGLAIARLLIKKNYNPAVYIIKSEKYSGDFMLNKERLEELSAIQFISDREDIPYIVDSDVVIDAIFGSGLNKKPEGIFEECINAINKSNAEVISVDIASGLFADKVTEGTVIIEPEFTISFQLPKLAFLLPQNEKYTGNWHLTDIGLNEEFIKKTETPFFYTDENTIKGWIKKRKRFSHKGTYGKSLIIGGSDGMMGAVVLAAKACLKAGTGLCKTHIPEGGYEILQISVPENVVLTDPSFNAITRMPDLKPYNAIGVGPGLSESEETKRALCELFKTAAIPLVIDAGALNLIASDKTLFNHIPAHSILTPHPKEFERLTGPARDDFHRLNLAKELAIKINCFIVLKGAFTVVCTPGGEFHFNSTGNPGMAKAGSGDVLTGIITSLLSQGYEPFKAAVLGVYIHGFAGDCAAQKYGEVSMVASDIIEGIHSFYISIKYDNKYGFYKFRHLIIKTSII
jgi:ADP-dependent NAD(P)H-hydrate dehydratase / NAD(P)H-hydrate epimerase